MKPMLMLASEGEVNVRKSADIIANNLGLTSQAKLEFAGNGNQRRYVNRTYWAATYLRQAGLLKTSRRGYVEITQEGIEFNKLHKNSISKADLENIPTYIEFQGRRGSRKGITNQINDNVEDSLTPDDKIDDALNEIETELAGVLLEQLQNSSPLFFERVVLDLFLSMGYGGSDEQTGEVLGKSGDDGVDGIINQDALGLERVYIQAKCYKSENTVSASAIRDFTGALNVQQASKGLFVTTTSFSKSAIETAEKVPQRIVLIDGNTLSRLMIKYGVGCSTQKTISIKKLDTDYFE